MAVLIFVLKEYKYSIRTASSAKFNYSKSEKRFWQASQMHSSVSKTAEITCFHPRFRCHNPENSLIFSARHH